MMQSFEISSNYYKSCVCVNMYIYIYIYETYKIQVLYQPVGPASLAVGMKNDMCLYCYIIIKLKSLSDKSCRP